MTNTHISDDLPLLLTGDATREVVHAAASHLRSCVDCQQELISALVAHASLVSAHRFAPEIVAPGDNRDDEIADLPPVTALPDLTKVFADAHAQDAAPPPVHHLRSRRALVAVAAAAAVIVGGGATYAVVQSSSSSDGPTTRTVALDPFDIGQNKASATIVGNNKLKVDATSLPKLNHSQIYEVWLTDRERTNMQSIGFIGDENKAVLTVSPKWMSQYKNIEVSVQDVNQDDYSGTSVLRGSYG